MMNITVGSNEYELKTNLMVAKKLEGRFKLPLPDIMQKIDNAEISELVSILAIAGEKEKDAEFADEILENWDYTDLQYAVQELLARLMFSGTPEQQEAKISKFPVGENQKNAIREMLGLPKKTISVQNNLSEQPTE